MKKKLKKILYVILILCLLVAASVIWVYVDPTNTFHKAIEEKMAEIVVSGQNVGVPPKYISFNERKFQTAYIEKVHTRDHVLAMGSGRIKYIRNNMFPNKKFHNAAVNGATLEDFVTLYYFYKERDLLPDKIILALDHWIIDAKPYYSYWHVYSAAHKDAVDQMGFKNQKTIDINGDGKHFWENARAARTKEIFSMDFLLMSVSRLFAGRSIFPRTVYPTREENTRSGLYIWLADGSMASEETPWSVEELRKLIATVDDGVPPLDNLDKGRLKDLEMLLNIMKKDGVVVELLMAPVHPDTYKKWIVEDKKGVIKAEEMFLQLAKRNNLKICGSFDPAKVSLAENEFQNWINPHESALRQILSSCNES